MKSKKWKLVIALVIILVLTLAIFFIVSILRFNGSFSTKNMSENEKLDRALAIGRLSALPQDKSEFVIDGTGNPFSSTYLFKFKSSEDSIINFIDNSPGLKGVTAHEITQVDSNVGQTKYIWFNVGDIRKGIMYQISQNGDGCYGTVYIDELNCIVYVIVSKS